MSGLTPTNLLIVLGDAGWNTPAWSLVSVLVTSGGIALVMLLVKWLASKSEQLSDAREQRANERHRDLTGRIDHVEERVERHHARTTEELQKMRMDLGERMARTEGRVEGILGKPIDTSGGGK